MTRVLWGKNRCKHDNLLSPGCWYDTSRSFLNILSPPADRKSSHSATHRAGTTTPRAAPQPMAAVAHSGIKLAPLRKRFQNTLPRLQTPHRTPPASQRPNLIGKSGSKSQHLSCRAECESGGEDSVPVRDISPQSGSLKAQEKKQAEDAEDTGSIDEGSAEGEVKRQTVQYLLRELKALIFGEGNVSFPPVSC